MLDIFAGTGALGLESMSRGANSATFIDTATTEIIRDNVTRAKFDDCTILRGDFEKILRRLSKPAICKRIGAEIFKSHRGIKFIKWIYNR